MRKKKLLLETSRSRSSTKKYMGMERTLMKMRQGGLRGDRGTKKV